MIHQLSPTIPLSTPRGPGLAHLILDYGEEHHLLWVVFLDRGGECWAFKNTDVRGQANPSMGRTLKSGSGQDCGPALAYTSSGTHGPGPSAPDAFREKCPSCDGPGQSCITCAGTGWITSPSLAPSCPPEALAALPAEYDTPRLVTQGSEKAIWWTGQVWSHTRSHIDDAGEFWHAEPKAVAEPVKPQSSEAALASLPTGWFAEPIPDAVRVYDGLIDGELASAHLDHGPAPTLVGCRVEWRDTTYRTTLGSFFWFHALNQWEEATGSLLGTSTWVATPLPPSRPDLDDTDADDLPPMPKQVKQKLRCCPEGIFLLRQAVVDAAKAWREVARNHGFATTTYMQALEHVCNAIDALERAEAEE